MFLWALLFQSVTIWGYRSRQYFYLIYILHRIYPLEHAK